MGTNTIKQSQTESDMTVESPWIPFENDIHNSSLKIQYIAKQPCAASTRDL